MEFGGLPRTYRLYVPSSVALSKPAALVLVLHGGLGSGAGAATQTGFDAEADRDRFVVVYPDGVDRTWNADGCCPPASRQGIDDVGFLVALIDRLSSEYRIDPNRVFATGISNGGMMAYRLACERGERFAAIGPVAATMFTTCKDGPPVSVVHIHGLADQNVPFVGGVGERSLTKVSYPPVDDGVHWWRLRNLCGADPSIERGDGVTVRTWTGCNGGAEVSMYTIESGGHSWPGGQRMAGFLDPPSEKLNATDIIWRFFAAHPRTG
jgi:polyhydroxybutyrate depolymerase